MVVDVSGNRDTLWVRFDSVFFSPRNSIQTYFLLILASFLLNFLYDSLEQRIGHVFDNVWHFDSYLLNVSVVPVWLIMILLVYYENDIHKFLEGFYLFILGFSSFELMMSGQCVSVWLNVFLVANFKQV